MSRGSNSQCAGPPHDQTKIRQWAYRGIKLKLKSPSYYCTDEKLSVREEWNTIDVAELGQLSNLISWQAPKSEGLLSEPKLGRNSSLREWQGVYLKQEEVFLFEKYKKDTGNNVKNTGKNLKI